MSGRNGREFSSRGRGRGRWGDQGRGRGRGGGGGRPDEMLDLDGARQYMSGQINRVLSATPVEFLEQSQADKQTPTRLALRPNAVNQVAQIWQQVGVELNMFKIETSVKTAYQYDLQVNRVVHGQPLENQEVYQRVFNLLREQQNWPPSTIHDGRKTIWDLRPDLPELDEQELWIDGGRRKVYVTFQKTRSIDMQQLQHNVLMQQVENVGWLIPIECLRVLDSAIKQGALYDIEGYALRAGSVFDLQQEGQVMNADEAYEVLMGYKESVRVVTEGLVLNLNTIYNLSRRGGSIMRFLQNNNVQNPHVQIEQFLLDSLSVKLAGVRILFKVEDRIQQREEIRKYKVKGFAEEGADSYSFSWDKNGETSTVTVEQYFQQMYGYQIEYPRLNLLECVSSGNRRVMVPAECCRILRGEFLKAEGHMQAELIRKAAKAPTLRHGDINSSVNDVMRRVTEDPAKFWISQLARTWMRGEGFLVPPPVIEYQDGFVMPVRGVWQGWEYNQNQDMQFHHYYKVKKIESFSVLSFLRQYNEVEDFCKDMVKFGNDHVMKNQIVPFERDIVVNCGNVQNASTELVMQFVDEAVDRANVVYKKNPQIIFVLFPRPSKEYNIIKAVFEGNNPQTKGSYKIPSQVVAISAYNKGTRNYGYLKQLMLKVNSKVGGSNFRIAGGYHSIPLGPQLVTQLQKEGRFFDFFPYMFMGADVTHPSPNSGGSSIAAVVGSMDINLARYGARIRAQKGRQENIEDMYNCTGSLVSQFRNENQGMLPQSIIMYRDGVSEGQFDQVLASEYPAMRSALKTFGHEYYPKICFVIVQKRHHCRPRPADAAADDGKGNMVPGVVIDRSGCHPFEFQFYLNSHATIQGTNRPALYTVLTDEVGFGAEQFILLTNWITYTYQRCPRSVSIPPPAYYAHHACTRGRLLEGQNCKEGMVVAGLEPQMYWI